uniref:Acyl-CoA thioesterase 19 n=1 Tax=Neogobius melanostomus TaxID=47308 RepID=A0A8C6TX17_9GOBI
QPHPAKSQHLKEPCYLSVQPCRALVDEKFKVLVQKAPPGAQLTVRSHHHSENKHEWEAFGHYICDSTGPRGTYEGVEPMGLLWSLRPVPGSKPGLRLRKMNVETPMEVTVSVYQGHLSEDFSEQRALAAVVVERWYMAPGVRRIPVTEHDTMLCSGPGRFPAVLDLWGGGGNLMEYRASLLASHGFAALVLDYLTNELTKTTGKMMENDYFEVAFKFLEQHPQIVGSRIAMWGLSFGTAMTLKMAVYSNVIKLRCAVCYSGSHIQPVDGSVKDIKEYMGKKRENIRVTENQEVIFRDLTLPVPKDPAFKVDMGRLQCPLQVVVGLDDQSWPAYESAMDMKVMMEEAGNSHLLTLLTYPHTGHLIEPPYSPYVRTSILRPFPVKVLWGGETAAHSRAQEDAWRKTLLFLREHLYDMRNSAVTSKSNL